MISRNSDKRRNSGSAGAHPLLRAGAPAQERSPDLLAVLGSSLSFVNAGLDALGATLATAIKFLLTLDFLMGHDSTPQSEKRNLWISTANPPVCPVQTYGRHSLLQ